MGYFLFTKPLGQPVKERKGGIYIAANVLLTLLLTLAPGFITDSFPAMALLLLPMSELVKNFIDFLILRVVRPSAVPRLEFRDGVPMDVKTLCVISALLTDAESGARFAGLLEEYRLANRDAGENLVFGILADLPESTEERIPDAETWFSAAAAEIDALNERFPGGFFLFTRERVEKDGRYMGWERKRGAILELAGLLRGKDSGVDVRAGDRDALSGVKYILTLDSDTRLCPGTARELIGAMAHPLNTPIVDESRRVVVSGTAVIQPRMSVELESAGRSDFSRFFAGQGGTDPYGSTSGEVYMDMWGRGSFSGKGIIDVDIFLKCLDGRIPENTVLSYDLLEGAYLRGQYMGDVELTDSYPSKALSYYTRMNRWTRGDWQNAPWLFKRGRDLSDIDRWKIFDNLRRSLVAPMTFIAILAGFLLPGGGLILSAVAALLSMASRLLLTIAESALRREPEKKARYHSTIIHGIGGGLIQTLVRLILLPFEAWVCLTAISAALWRMLVSHRNMLSWTTAAQNDAKALGGVSGYYAKMWIVLPVSVLSGCFSSAIIGRVAGLVWLFSPIYALALSRERSVFKPPTESDRKYLIQCAREMWRFFETFTQAEDNYLPPDNWQEQPPVGTAHRTSPTNIGLSLLSALAAADLGVTSRDRALEHVENILTTMERMQKWNGHLYNWYDTRTLKSLTPNYVSTVDSGNLAGCLIALKNGLLEFERPDLAERADALIRDMDFARLYDPTRRLFYIGMDLDKDSPTEGWYDLLASEARLAGYIAIAKGDVERRHWRRLGRSLVSKDGYRGMASWTCTMFEYLMPELVLPFYRDSLLYESAKFCVYVKKRRAGTKIPWGISESAFYSLDPSLSYRYKAHGCAALALKRGMNQELVVSPYSSFLALLIEPRGVVKNLKALERLGARGRYGFREAVDFTPPRLAVGEYAVVRCVMAHHLGMSLVSIANYLCGNAAQRRFMSNADMSAHVGLFQEKVPIGGVLLRKRDREVPEKPSRARLGQWEKSGEGIDFVNPEICLLSNGTYHLIAAESGTVKSQTGDMLLYKYADRHLSDGTNAMLYFRHGTELTPLLPCAGNPDLDYARSFDSERAEFSVHGHVVEAVSDISVSDTLPDELRRVSLRGGAPIDGELVFTFEPVLSRENDYRNHPAFYKLGMRFYTRDGSLIIRRLKRGTLDECFLCVSCDRDFEVSASRDHLPGRIGLAAALQTHHSPKLGWIADPFVSVRAPVSLKSGEFTEMRIALCLGATEDEALAGSRQILAMPDTERASLPRQSAAILGMDTEGMSTAMYLLKHLVFPPFFRPVAAEIGVGADIKREGLWKFGVSGDLPIICAVFARQDQQENAETLLRCHTLLTSCGVGFDLIVITDDGGDYRRPFNSVLWESLRKLGRESAVGARGGIHFAENSRDASALLVSAVHVFDLDKKPEESARVTDAAYLSDSVNAPAQSKPEFTWNDSFSLYVRDSLPPRAWGNILTNENFGFFSTDCGTGHMWHKNSREFRVNRWLNDPLAVHGTETLELLTDTGRHSLFASPNDRECRVDFMFGATVWEKRVGDVRVKTTAFVPPDIDARVLIIEIKGATSEKFAWYTDLVLSADDKDSQQVITAFSDALLTARNPRGVLPNQHFTAYSSVEAESFTCDRLAWKRCAPSGEYGAGFDPCFGAVYPARERMVIVTGCDNPNKLKLDYAAAKSELEHTLDYWRSVTDSLKISTPDPALDRLINGWSLYQSVACRVVGRASIYQNGGSYGFRDQLQDLTNLTPHFPNRVRQHIIRCCARQYEEGDVLHWWHEIGSTLKGARTRCSDDLLWLPWALVEYIEKTSDYTILAEQTPYLRSKALGRAEHERYESPEISANSDTVLEHAKKAVELAIERGPGAHGLILMGGGDWNDGMDKVGAMDVGESVWLTWFFAAVTKDFAALLEKIGDTKTARRYDAIASDYARAADSAWDGQWYLRGYFDSGLPLGSATGEGCQIDSIAQSFSVYCSDASPERRDRAISSAVERLFDREKGIVRLFDPPFEKSADGTAPGYIESYGPGFRENGGQYTHGAIWLAIACLRVCKVQEGYEILTALLPEKHDTSVYGAEPFVIPADVYTADGSDGRAGWTWYTGSSAWYHRAVVEELLGLKTRAGRLFIEPRLPKGWHGYSAVWRLSDGEELSIEVAGEKITVNGEVLDTSIGIPLTTKKLKKTVAL